MKLTLLLIISIAVSALSQSTPIMLGGVKGNKPTPKFRTTKNPAEISKKSVLTHSDFKEKFNKTYPTKEAEIEAEKIFNAVKAEIDAFNNDPKKKFVKAINSMSDLSPQTIQSTRMGMKIDKNVTNTSNNSTKLKSSQSTMGVSFNASLKAAMPSSYDLTDEMSPIKDQLNCGACWTFAAIAPLEYKSKKENKNLIYSEQSLIDCDKKFFNDGCEGGLPMRAYRYIKEQGLALSSEYPWVGKNEICKPFTAQMVTTNGCYYEGVSEDDLKVMLLKFGPLAIGINAMEDLYYYSSGVFLSNNCPNNWYNVNHAVVLVGYGTDPVGGDYWVIRNSWGPSWGMGGYARMARNRNNHCGIACLIAAPCN